MASNWVTQSLNLLPVDFIDGDRSSRYPKRSDYIEGSDIIFLNADSISSGKLDLSSVNFLSEATYSGITKGRLKKGDLVLTMRGNGVGKVAYYGLNLRGLINAQMLIIRPNPNHIEAQYLYYYFSNPIFQKELQGYVSGSAQPQLTITHLRKIPVTLPPLSEQRAIAPILGSLDDKIEANRRLNATLEATARALFQSWFVDFDPVYAKARGEQPSGMDAETAALFPDSFEDSELGPIPAGWEVGRLDDLLILQRGFDLPSEQRIPGAYPILAASGPSGTHNEYKVKGPGVTTGRSGVLGNVFFVQQDYWPLNTSLWVKEFRRTRPLHAYHLLSGLDFGLFNAGSAVPTLNRNHIHTLKVVIPTFNIIDKFEKLITPLFELKYQRELESRSLAETRDALLPKLVSGELQVGEIENYTEEIS